MELKPMRRRGWLVGGLAVVALVACSPSPVGTPPPSTSASASPSAVPSATPAARFVVDYQELTKTYNGDARVLELYVPKLPPDTTAPLIVMLHALNSSPFAAIMLTHFDLVAARYGAIVVAPPSAGRGWVTDLRPEPDADIRYLSALLDDLRATLPVDPKQVFVAGFSIGAVMTDRVGCEFADRVAAIAIDSGSPWSDTCQPAKPVSALIMHGTADSTFDYADAQALAARWRLVDACPGDPVTSQLGSSATAETSDGCEAGTAVEFVTIPGGIHAWFTHPDATELAWQFFAKHPRP
jgi:polyhydroxybutyrate depolymerase